MSRNIKKLIPLAKLYDVQRTSLCRASKEFCKTKLSFMLCWADLPSFFLPKENSFAQFLKFIIASSRETQRSSFLSNYHLGIRRAGERRRRAAANDVQTIFMIPGFWSPLLTVRHLPPFTILLEVILTLLNAPRWRTGDRRPSPNYPGFPTTRPAKNGDAYKWCHACMESCPLRAAT